MKQPVISQRMTVALDAARVAAATYVVLYHLTLEHHLQHGIGMIFGLGQEAVIVFFLLSGFVIFANERDRLTPPGGYYLRRFRRIYPPLIVAMLVSTLIYLDDGIFLESFKWGDLIGTLLMVQDISSIKPGVIVDPYLVNGPLWSLSYEMPFYLVFPFAARMLAGRPAVTHHAIGLICILSYAIYMLVPNHWTLVAAYFLIWWIGAMCAQAYLGGRAAARGMLLGAAYLLGLCALAGFDVWRAGYKGLGVYPFLPFRHFVAAELFLLAALLLWRWVAIDVPARLRAFIAFVASISYGLYIFHYPIMVEWRRADSSPLGLAIAGVLLVAISWLGDRQLSAWLRRRRFHPI